MVNSIRILTEFLVTSEDYFEEVGRDINYAESDFSLRKWLESIEHIKAECRQGTIVYFSESPHQAHLVKMIRKQKNHQRSIRKARKGLHDEFDSAPFSTPKFLRDSTILRTRKSIDTSFQQQSLSKSIFKQPKVFSRTFMCSSKIPKRSLPVTSSVIGSAQIKFPHFVSSDDEDNNKSNNSNSFRAPKMSFITDKIIEATCVS